MNIFSIKRLIMGALYTQISMATHASETVVVEWAPFEKNPTVTIQQIISAANQVNIEFLSKQSGFIKRELIQKSTNEFADVIHWQSLADAENAAEKVTNCQPCNEYFGLMDMLKSEKSGAGFNYYKLLKSW